MYITGGAQHEIEKHFCMGGSFPFVDVACRLQQRKYKYGSVR